MTSGTDSRQSLRRDMRRQRRALPVHERQQAALRLGRRLGQQLWFRRARHIGSYLPTAGEIDTLPALQRHWRRDTHLYLPVISTHPEVSMRMIGWIPGEQLLTNRYGIREPDPRRHQGRPLWALDLLLVPLVAFDAAGNRLGMGGGFYDRLLAGLSRHPRRPRLVGVAYRFQQVACIPVQPWDRPLDLVITD